MLGVLSEFELKHQSHLAEFARAIDAASSELSSAAKDLHYRSTADLFQHEFKAQDASTQAGSAPTLLVTVPIDEMRKHADGQPALATVTRTSEMIPVAEATRIACEGAIQAAGADKNGTILKLGRSTRLFSPAQRKALNLEYPECATSGCDVPAAWCESHHIRWWSRGGATDSGNGVNLCNYHHHQVHMGHSELQQDSQTHRWKAVRAIRR